METLYELKRKKAEANDKMNLYYVLILILVGQLGGIFGLTSLVIAAYMLLNHAIERGKLVYIVHLAEQDKDIAEKKKAMFDGKRPAN